jgi:ATP-binding cassette subfamily F protein uup
LHAEPNKPTQNKSPNKLKRGHSLQTKKLSYHQQRQLEQLPQKILALEATIREIHETLADTNLFTKNPQAFLKAANALEHAQKELEACEEEWLQLEELHEG